MVLTNLEFWAADGSSSLPSSALEFDTSAHMHQRHNNPFDPRVVPHIPTRNMTHLSSNGYYGFSYINAAHELNNDNNNNNNIDITNNNNIMAHDFMANDVNNISQMPQSAATPPTQQHLYANFIGNNNNNYAVNKLPVNHNTNVAAVTNAAAAANAVVTSRCKKRFFVLNGNDADDSSDNSYCTNAPAKRCRFDDDFAAQYCNDFFSSLPNAATTVAAPPQIATQSCLMDTEEVTVQQTTVAEQQQVDEAMYENNNNNIYNYNNNNVEKYEQSILHLQLQHQQQQQQQQSQMPTQQPPTLQQQQTQEQQQQQQPHQYHHHQQQHYQGHLHRANRDVSRCMLSHMI